ncbi:MAG: pitrilysin family protein [Acidiferrobacteraceae bacterium]|jgi:zinc protease
MRRQFPVFLAIVLAAIALSGCSRTHETTLANGMRIIVQEDHRSPVVVSQVWYKVGGIDEPKGITGISHVLEHMMFKGTKKHPAGEFSRIIAENGGRENAFTSRDYTVYFQTLEKSRLPIAFELEADRMQNLTLDPKEFKKELQVVMEERRMRTEDSPAGRLYEGFSAAAFHVHPYGNPIIGWSEDLKHLTVDKVRDWYKRFYAPNNATLVVVGDVKPKEVIELARKYFGPVPRHKINRTIPPPEPPQKETRHVEVSVPAKVPQIMIGFHTPVLGKTKKPWEPYALDVLSGLLSGGKSARLPQELVRRQRVAVAADSGYDDIARAPDLFTLSATPANGHTVKDVQQALLQQIERIKDDPITKQEMDRVKAQVTASDVYQRDSMFYQALEIGMLATTGLDWRLIDSYANQINSVTPEQVREVAKRYLVPKNMTVAVLKPLPLKGPAPRPMMPGGSDVIR